MSDALAAKLRQGRPVRLTAEESALLVEALREAVATTLDVPLAEVGDDARVFDDLGLDSIDVFDVVDQLAERFGVTVPLEELPESVLRGGGGGSEGGSPGDDAGTAAGAAAGAPVTFRIFADGLLRYFREAPAPPGEG